MKGHDQIIDVLNDVLTAELTAINQYFIHAKMCENWGYERLCEEVREESIDEMKHADRLIERILYLEGVPNLQRLDKVNVGETVPEQLEARPRRRGRGDQAPQRGHRAPRAAATTARAISSSEILDGRRAACDWIEAQLELIKQVGEQNYLAQQIKKEE